jgi:hypothetical protein
LREEIDTERGLALLDARPAEAVALLRGARRRFELAYAAMTPAHADALVGLGRSELRAGAMAAAMPLLAAADRFWMEFDGTSRWSGEAAYYLGTVQLAGGDVTAGRATLERAAAILSRSALPSDTALARAARAELTGAR